jgi:CDP-6-deoxy-D-xylo-4-hexulose-3-dehydrase
MQEYNWPLMKNSINWVDKLKLIKFILTSSRYTQGEKVFEFESAWNNWLGSKYSLFVTSGSTANFLLVSAVMEKYNIKKGDKVLLPACTWVTNVSPPIQLGMTPIFCDVNLSNYSFDETHLEKIKEQHPDIKLIFVTHLLGIPAPYKKLKETFPNAIIIDDVCESHGCLDQDLNKVGSNSIGATFSFYFGHHMTTVEGGMVSTNDKELYDLMRMKRSHGMARNSVDPKKYSEMYPDIHKSFLFVTDGYNFRNTEFSAVLGLSQLKRLDNSIRKRKNNYLNYYDIMSKYTDLFYPISYHGGNSCFCFPLIAKEKKIKDRLIELFDEYGIEHRPVVGGNLLRQPFLSNISADCPNADVIHTNGIYIGNSQFVSKHNMEVLRQILNAL